MPRDLYDDIDYILLNAEQIKDRTDELASEISEHYEDVEELLVICVLKGAYVFMSDFSRALTRPHILDFMVVSSYGDDTESSGVVKIIMDLKRNIAGRHVLLIEDIIDSGHTLHKLTQLLNIREPASLRICTLLNKPARRDESVTLEVDHVGFEIPDEFVVGYGLDYQGLYRNLPFVGVLKPEVFSGE